MDSVCLQLLEDPTPGRIYTLTEVFTDANKIIDGVMYALEKEYNERVERRTRQIEKQAANK